MSFSFDLYWSFRSPYSYLATHRLVALEHSYDLTINVKPVHPIAVRMPDFFDRIDPKWLGYIINDCKRIAEKENLTFIFPKPDPIVQNMETREIAPEQPYIHRLTRLGIAATRRGKGLAFLDEASRLIFGGTVGWDEGPHLAGAAERAGLDLAEMETAIAADEAGHDEEIEANQADQLEAGHWGVPLMVFNGEPFFGQDRIDLLVWRMEKAGLERR